MGNDVMTHNFKTGVTYKHRDGRPVTYIGDGVNYNQPVFEYEGMGLCGMFPNAGHFPESDIIGLYEDEPEEIDVANMWVGIRYSVDGHCILATMLWRTRELLLEAYNDLIAAYQVREYEAIKRGERKLRIGEGL